MTKNLSQESKRPKPRSALVALLAAVSAMLSPTPEPRPTRQRKQWPPMPLVPAAVAGVPHVQQPEQFHELSWRSVGPSGRLTTCVVVAPAMRDGYEVWVTAGRGAGLVTPIRRARSLTVARRIAAGLAMLHGAPARLSREKAGVRIASAMLDAADAADRNSQAPANRETQPATRLDRGAEEPRP